MKLADLSLIEPAAVPLLSRGKESGRRQHAIMPQQGTSIRRPRALRKEAGSKLLRLQPRWPRPGSESYNFRSKPRNALEDADQQPGIMQVLVLQ